MDPNMLTNEQKAKLKSCKDSAELQSMLNSMGVELSDEQLEAAAGGGDWNEPCNSETCNCDIHMQ